MTIISAKTEENSTLEPSEVATKNQTELPPIPVVVIKNETAGADSSVAQTYEEKQQVKDDFLKDILAFLLAKGSKNDNQS